jgi:uncharacterized membrane protein YedE/YeeE
MELLLSRCPWWLGGPILGLVVVGLQWASNLGLGVTGAFGEVLELGRPTQGKRQVDWRVFLFLGVLLGALIFGLLTRFGGEGSPTFGHGSFDLRFASSLWAKGPILAGAGILIGFGARLAGGCTSGAGLCGVPRLSKGSIATTCAFATVAMASAQVIAAVFPGGAS